MCQFFTIYIYTAGVKEYADKIIDLIDTQKVVQQRFYRDSCRIEGNRYIKNLQKLNFDLKKTLFIDNELYQIEGNLENGILIDSFVGQKDDRQLVVFKQAIRNLLIKDSNPQDIRSCLD